MDGWRQWSLVDTRNGLRLKGHWGNAWETPYARADTVPEQFNNSGIYAYKDLSYVINTLSSPLGFLGRVELGGKIVEHSDGRVRSEYCRIKYFVTQESNRLTLGAQLQHYGLPVLGINLQELVLEYLSRWEQVNELFLPQQGVGPEGIQDFHIPGKPDPPKVELELPRGMTEGQLLKALGNYAAAKSRRKDALVKRRAAQDAARRNALLRLRKELGK